MKGIVLAGGLGTRLYPATKTISKQMIPIYDKPMIYYPISILMLAGIRDILIISDYNNMSNFKKLFRDGKQIGLNIKYKIQERPEGLAQAFIIGEDFIKDDKVALILGDNIFYGQGFSSDLKIASEIQSGACIFAYYMQNPSNFGVVEFDENNNVISLEEKPEHPKSKFIVPGLYFYDNTVIEKARSLKPSERNELEITDLNKLYMKEGTLKVQVLGRGLAWLDMGTHRSLLQASNFVQAIEDVQGIHIACLEEISYRNGWITKEQLLELSYPLAKTSYGKYLINIAENEH
ncbi:MAG: glucose-1-phosphate thymidylyltransferase RfbA [Clostridium butyricum]|nr:glucose-1-phosphate thymidylyltransferase RfbA [Clostridium butyricum]